MHRNLIFAGRFPQKSPIISGSFAENDTATLCHPACYRVAKMHRMPYFFKSFSAKEPLIIGLFCGK